MLHVSPSRKPHSPSLGAVGHWRFCATQPEVGKPSGLFPRARRGHCFIALCPGNCAAHRWGAVGELALPHHAAGNGSRAIKEKKRRKFPPLF